MLFERVGEESTANTAVAGAQTVPEIIHFGDGRFAIVWQDASATPPDASGAAIRLQLFNVDGTKAGAEVLVNTSILNGQTDPDIALLADGSFVVTWTDASVTASGNDIRGQLFTTAGVKSGLEFVANAAPLTGSQSASQVIGLNDGRFAVAWTTDQEGGTAGVRARLFSATGAAVGSEIAINTLVAGAQQNVGIAALGSGAFVVTWQDGSGAAGAGTDIRAQIVSSAGAKVGGEILVSAASSTQELPTIASLAGGGFAIAWSDFSGVGDLQGLKARIYDGAGVAQGAEFLVNTTTLGGQSQINLSALPGGGFFATWRDASGTGLDTSSNAIRGQAFAGDGSRQGSEFLVNSVTAGSQDRPAVAAWSGGITIAWQDGSGTAPDASGSGIRFRRFAIDSDGPPEFALATTGLTETSIENIEVGRLSANGLVNSVPTYTILADSTGGAFSLKGDRLIVADNARLDHETAATATLTIRATDENGFARDQTFVVAIGGDAIEKRYLASDAYEVSASDSDSGSPAVAMLAGGGSVFVWSTSDVGDPTGIYAQLYDAEGAEIGVKIRVNAEFIEALESLAVTALPNGGFVVAWASPGPNGDDGGIFARRFAADGASLYQEILVSGSGPGERHDPAAASLSDGGYVIAWHSFGQDSGFTAGIYVQRYDELGEPQGNETLVNTEVANNQHFAAVAGLAQGGYVIVWEASGGQDGGGSGIFAQRFDALGARQGNEFQVNTSFVGNQAAPTVAALADGGFAIAWLSEAHGIYVQRFDELGQRQGAQLKVNSQGADPEMPAIAALPDGGFIVTWSNGDDLDGSGHGVFGQRFDRTGAPTGAEFRISDATASDQMETALASQGDRFLIAWLDNASGISKVHARNFVLINASPIANADTLATTEDGSATYAASDLIGNDTDEDGDALTITAVSGAIGGSVVLNADGTIGFTPTPDFNGAAGFDYEVSDGNGGAATGHATVAVSAVNDAPVAVSATVSAPLIQEDTPSTTGHTVASLFGAAFSDARDGQTASGGSAANDFAGIAIVTNGATAAQGRWQYHDGNGWVNVGTVFPAQSLLLPADTAIRFLPAADYHGTPTLAAHLVDNSDGPVSIGTANVSATGGATRYSASVVTLNQTVTSVADVTVVGGSTAQRAFVEGVNGAADHILVNDSVTLSDPDSPPFAYLRILITNRVVGEDVLAFVNNNWSAYGDIVASYNASIGSLLLSSPSETATLAQFQAAARAVTYDNLSEEPTQGIRNIQISTLEGFTISAALSFTILVTAQNDAPSGTNSTISIAEDAVRTLAANDFGFSDVDGDAFVGVRFGSAPVGGKLYFDADGAGSGTPTAITASPTMIYSATDIAAGKIIFVPTANLNGEGAAKIFFTVVDDGSVAGSGTNADLSPNVLSFDISAVNDAPTVVITLPKGQPIGGETRVNTSTTGTESNASTAALPDGSYVTVWQASPDVGGNETDIFLRRFDAAGAPLGGEVRVNSTIISYQARPDVSALAGGGFVISWDAYEGVYAQRYNAAGAKVGGEILVHASISNEELYSASAALTGGGFVVTWQSKYQDISGTAIIAQRYDSSGVAQGGAVRINTATANDQAQPAIIGLEGGGYIIAWTSWQQDGPGSGVYGQRFDSAGIAQGSEFLINTTTAGIQKGASLAALPGGGFVVTWESSDADANFNSYHVYSQRFDAGGTKAGGETLVGAGATSSVAALATGGFVVSWLSFDGDSSGISARRFDAVGNPIGSAVQANTLTEGSQLDPDVVGLPGGDLLVTWTTHSHGTNPHQVSAQRFGEGLVATEGFALPLTGVVSIDDFDAGAAAISVSLNVGSGMIFATTFDGNVAIEGSGSGSLTLTGTLAEINMLLSGTSGFLFYQTDSDTPPASTPLTLTVNDDGNSGAGGPLSASASATIVIRPLNDAPASADATRAILEDGIYTLKLSDFAFSDPDGNAMFGVRFNGVVGGTLYYDADGTGPTVAGFAGSSVFTVAEILAGKLSFVPTANLNGAGAAILHFTVIDDGPTGSYGGSAIHHNADQSPHRIFFDIAAVNDAPAGRELSATINEDTSHSFTLANFGFSDPDGNAALNVIITSAPVNGALYLDSDGNSATPALTLAAGTVVSVADIDAGRLTYRPPLDGNGTSLPGYDRVYFKLQDNGGTANGGIDIDPTDNIFRLYVTPVNDLPVLTGSAGDAAYIEGLGAVSVDAGLTLTDVDSSTFSAVARFSQGTSTGDILSFINDNSALYGSITGTWNDGQRQILLSGAGTVEQWQNALRAVKYDSVSDSPGSFARQVTFSVQDGSGQGSTTLIRYVTVTPVNDAPIANPDSGTTNEDQAITFVQSAMTGNDTDGDGDGLTVIGIANVTGGSAVRATNGFVTFTPTPDFNGIGGFDYEVSDGKGGTATAHVSVNITARNDSPTVSFTDGAVATEQVPLDIKARIAIGDVDGPDELLTLTLIAGLGTISVTPGSSGVDILSGNGSTFVKLSGTRSELHALLASGSDGAVAYLIDSDNPVASESLTIIVNDAAGAQANVFPTITFIAINDAPSGPTDKTETVIEDSLHVISGETLEVGYLDPERDAMGWVKITRLPVLSANPAASAGTLYFDPDGAGPLEMFAASVGQLIAKADLDAGRLLYRPAANASGDNYAFLEYAVVDSKGLEDPTPGRLTLNVWPINDAPVAIADAVTIDEDQAITVGRLAITGNDTDADGDVLGVTAVSNVTGGTAVLNADGSVTFTPTANFNGVAGYDYIVSDGNDGSASGHVTVTIEAVNDAPMVSDGAPRATGEHYPIAVNPSVSITDVDLEARNSGAGNFAGATLTFARSGGANLADRFTIQDGAGFTVSGNTLIAMDGEFATFSYANGELVITFTGAGSIASTALVNAVAQAVRYNNISDAPPAFVDIAYTLNDGAASGNQGANTSPAQALDTGLTRITITAENDRPWLDLLNSGLPGTGQDVTLSYTENAAATLVAPNASLLDPDLQDFSGGELIINIFEGGTAADQLTFLHHGMGAGQIGVSGANLFYAGALIGSFTGGADGTPITVTFNAGAFNDGVTALIRRLAFSNSSDNPSTADRKIALYVTDGDGWTSNEGRATVNLVATDDAPIAKADAISTAENIIKTGSLFLDNGSGADVELDTPILAVGQVNGSPTNVGVPIMLASGAMLTVNADGTYSYNPNGKFDWLTDGSQGALSSATETFTYTLAGGNSATVTVAITGVAGPGDQLRGGAGNDIIIGTSQFDAFYLDLGGEDRATGFGGNDGFYLGEELSLGDYIDGGSGTDDQLVIQGDYVDHQLGDNNLLGIETLVLLSSTDQRFGDTGGQSYDYWLKASDAGLATGGVLRITANSLQAGEDFIFDGRTETSGVFHIFAGLGNDTLTGGGGADGFFFGNGGRFTAADSVNGGTGPADDQLVLRGDYSTQIIFGAATIANVETLVVLSASDTRFATGGAVFTYNLMTHDDNVAAGTRLIVNANSLRPNESLIFDGRFETDGHFRLIGSSGADILSGGEGDDELYGALGIDQLTGNGGSDTFIYRAATESTAASQDTIRVFQSVDRISLAGIDAVAGTAANDAFTYIGDAAFSRVAGQLRLVGDNQTQSWFVEGDTDGDGNADFTLAIITTGADTILESNFIL